MNTLKIIDYRKFREHAWSLNSSRLSQYIPETEQSALRVCLLDYHATLEKKTNVTGSSYWVAQFQEQAMLAMFLLRWA
jgi:hypothetical protein